MSHRVVTRQHMGFRVEGEPSGHSARARAIFPRAVRLRPKATLEKERQHLKALRQEVRRLRPKWRRQKPAGRVVGLRPSAGLAGSGVMKCVQLHVDPIATKPLSSNTRGRGVPVLSGDLSGGNTPSFVPGGV